MPTFVKKFGPWALVTGGATGLGAEFARQIAERGLRVVMIDIDQPGLRRTAAAIRRDTGQEIIAGVVDLSQPKFIDRIRALTKGLEIGLLVNNAAISGVGQFLRRPVEDHLRAVAVNVRAPLVLTHTFASAMAARRRGGIILVSSMSALQGTAYVANYAATKAYDLILAEGLWQELRQHGVDVLGFLPGSTRTTGFLRSQPQVGRAGPMPLMEVGPTVSAALDALGHGPQEVAGRLNQFFATVMQRFLPRSVAIDLISRSMTELYEGPRAAAETRPKRPPRARTRTGRQT